MTLSAQLAFLPIRSLPGRSRASRTDQVSDPNADLCTKLAPLVFTVNGRMTHAFLSRTVARNHVEVTMHNIISTTMFLLFSPPISPNVTHSHSKRDLRLSLSLSELGLDLILRSAFHQAVRPRVITTFVKEAFVFLLPLLVFLPRWSIDRR